MAEGLVLAVAAVAALIWANVAGGSYQSFWGAHVTISAGHFGLELSLHELVNSGLMAFFFLVVGLEARREFDLGDLRVRSRLVVPVCAGLCGMLLPAGIYLSLNRGGLAGHGWGTAMSSDTAFALGALALAGRGVPDRVRLYLLTFSVVDDLAGIAVIAVVYSGTIHVGWLLTGIGLLAVAAGVRFVPRWLRPGTLLPRRLRPGRRLGTGPAWLLLGVLAWIAFWSSGVDPLLVGLVMGLLVYAAPASRPALEQASAAYRSFREQPTAALAATASSVARSAVSPNERLEQLWAPWTGYLIVPVFALANAGVALSGSFLAGAARSPVTLGIVASYLIGKPLGTSGGAALVTRLSRGRLRPPVGWGSVLGAGTAAGTGFTVSLLIAALAFRHHPELLDRAKAGILVVTLGASGLTWLVFRGLRALPHQRKLRLLLGSAPPLTDLAVPVNPELDHVRGPDGAPVTIVEYADFECPYCGQAEPAVRALLRSRDDIRYVFRHLPLTDVHPHAELAAEAAEAAGQYGLFWEMHDLLFAHQDALTFSALTGYAASLNLDAETFAADVRGRHAAARITADVDSADLSGASGTPTFFINGVRHQGAYDLVSLTEAVRLALARARI